jgi:hypothetical protein
MLVRGVFVEQNSLIRRIVMCITGVLVCASTGCSLNRTPLQGNARGHMYSSISAGYGGGVGGGNAFGGSGTGGSGGGPINCGPNGVSNGVSCINTEHAGMLPSGMCEPSGVFGVRVSVDVAWGGRNTPLGFITDNGRGRIVTHLKLTIDHVNPDGTFIAKVTPCNMELPPFFSSVLCEVYQPVFPTQMWDSPSMRVMDEAGRYDCTAPGCVMHLTPATALVGLDLDDPNMVWPDSTQTQSVQCPGGTGQPCFIDHDGDGQPGVTIKLATQGANPPNQVCKSGYPFRNAPLTTDLVMLGTGTAPRAESLYLGTRVRIGGEGMITPGCGQRIGEGAAHGFDSREISCAVQQPSGQPCDATQQMFMDANLPVYSVLTDGQPPPAALDLPDKSLSTGATFALTRLGDATDMVTCGDVRAAKY